jgi:flagellar hook-associated protein 3 FlgL
MTEVDGAFDSVQHLLGAVGARASSLEITGANLDAVKAGLVVLKSDVEDVEIEEAITELMSRQTSYQAALMTTSRLMGLTLTDYLR